MATQTSNESSADYAKMMDCGDGVPPLTLVVEPLAVYAERSAAKTPIATAGTLAVLATVACQLAISVLVLAGANLLLCSVMVVALVFVGLAVALAPVIYVDK